MKIKQLLASGLIVAVLMVGVGILPSLRSQANSATEITVSRIGTEVLTEAEQIFTDVYQNLSPSVVAISTTLEDNSGLVGVATGSGFVIDTSGDIVTNYHVVEGAARIEVSMYDGTITRGEVVGLDADSDIAVIRIDVPQERLRPVVFANSENLQVGQAVLALGNPFQRDWTLTSGIISAVNRRIQGLTGYNVGGVIQTDAAINPGNSGGPLLNLRGEVIGMNSQIVSETGANSGIGFSIPSNLIAKVASALIENGEVSYSFLGINSRPIDLDVIEAFGLPNNIRGAAVLEAIDGYPAALAGIRSVSDNGIDIIVAVEGIPLHDFDELVGWLAINSVPGQTITLTVNRMGQVFDAPVTLIERPVR